MRAKAIFSISALVLAAGLLFSIDAKAAQVVNGEKAPDFEYEDVKGNKGSLLDHKGKIVVLEWFNHGCPFVRKHYESGRMQGLQAQALGRDVVWIAVNSTSDAHGDYQNPEDTLSKALQEGTGASTIVLDPEGTIGKLYGAKTTPHIFIIDPEGTLIYQGAADSIKSIDTADIPKATNYIEVGLEEVMNEEPLTHPETKAYGCSVKYK